MLGTIGSLFLITAAVLLFFLRQPAEASNPDFRAVDGVPCDQGEQTQVHYHAHVAIFADNASRQIPYAIGIGSPQPPTGPDDAPYVSSGECFYWLHTHSNDGIIHIESPSDKQFTLGQLFDIWGQPLSQIQVGGDRGMVVAYVDGQVYRGNPRDIVLRRHEVIQLDVGSALPDPQPYTFPEGL